MEGMKSVEVGQGGREKLIQVSDREKKHELKEGGSSEGRERLGAEVWRNEETQEGGRERGRLLKMGWGEIDKTCKEREGEKA